MKSKLSPSACERYEPSAPLLPAGESIDLPGRGITFARRAGIEHPGPTFVLLHGWTVNADLNFWRAYGPLSQAVPLLALDHRGHGRGIRSAERFGLADCADDVAALACQLGLNRIVPVGYSMGGLIGQLLWQRHRSLVAGLVLASTARNFKGNPGDRVYFSGLRGLAAASRVTPLAARAKISRRYLKSKLRALDLQAWGASQLATLDVAKMTEAGAAIGDFDSRRWAADIDVPTAVVVTTRDTKVPTARQEALAAAIPGATTLRVEGDHHCIATAPDRYVPVLVAACQQVASRIDA